MPPALLEEVRLYQPTPGTVLFLGYGSQAVGLPDETQRFNWQPLRRRSDYFFVKYSYLLRRGSRSRIRAERVEVRDDLGVRAGPCVHVGAPRFDDANDDCRHFFSTLRAR